MSNIVPVLMASRRGTSKGCVPNSMPRENLPVVDRCPILKPRIFGPPENEAEQESFFRIDRRSPFEFAIRIHERSGMVEIVRIFGSLAQIDRFSMQAGCERPREILRGREPAGALAIVGLVIGPCPGPRTGNIYDSFARCQER